MEQRNLGNSGLKVSTLCLGAMTFGEADSNSFMHGVSCDEATSHRLIERSLEAGVNFIDTADVYGQDGLSERILGNWFQTSGRREEVVLATKFRFAMPYGKGGSRRHILRACEESLRRLQTDHIDLYQIHMQDLDVPEEETLRALDDLVHQGKVRYIGASNYAAWRLMDSGWVSTTRNLAAFVSLQIQYNLLERNIEYEHVPVVRRMGLGIIPWSPLARGFLSGKYRPGDAPPAGARLERWKDSFRKADLPRNWATLAVVEAVADEVESSPAAVALAWLLHKDRVSSVIFGARTEEQLSANLQAAKVKLNADQMARLDGVSAEPLRYPYDFMHRIQGRW